MSVDFGVSFDVDHRVVPARVEVPDDRAEPPQLTTPPPPSWHAPPAQPLLDRR